MACKSCKKTKKIKDGFDGGINAFQEKVNQRKKELDFIHENIDPNSFSTTFLERFLLILFCWVPLVIGYVAIVRWFISLF